LNVSVFQLWAAPRGTGTAEAAAIPPGERRMQVPRNIHVEEPNLTVELTGHFGDVNKYASVPGFIFLCVVAVAGPVLVGMMHVTPMLRAQSGAAQTQTS
jgi:hypothetical protein